MPVEVGVVLIGAGFAVGVSLAVAVWFERWKAKQPDPEGKKKPRLGGACKGASCCCQLATF